MNMRKLETLALLSLGIGLLLWGMDRQPVQVVHVREQGRMAVSELQAGSVHKGVADPVHLFQTSLTVTIPHNAHVHCTVYVPAYPAIRIMSGRSRVDLATTLSIHNTSREKFLLLKQIDYHDTDGKLIQGYLDKSVALKPLGTIELLRQPRPPGAHCATGVRSRIADAGLAPLQQGDLRG